ncbi:MAG: VanZ family protein [Pseudomonadota bacterium]
MKDNHRNFLIYWLPVVLYCVVIFIQSAYPSMAQLQEVPFGDKYLHVAGYALLGFLFFRAFRSLPVGNRLFVVSLLSILASTAYGISDEIHQYFVPYRTADVMDVLADMVGSCLGVTAYFLLVEKYDFLPKHPWIDRLRQYL